MFETIEDVVTFEVAIGGHIILCSKVRGIVLAEHRFDLGERPDVELALLPLGIGIERCGEGSLRRRHLPGQPGDGLSGAAAEQFVTGALPRQREQLEQQRIVVEHLLEVRGQPAVVDRIAREAAAEMVVDAAFTHARERQLHSAEIAPVVQALPCPP